MAALQQPLLRAAAASAAGGLDADVLVSGAGPVGLLMAIELKQRGVRVRIIDRLAQQDKKTKAIGVQKSSFRVLPTAVLRRIQAESCQVKGFRLHEVVGSQRTELVHLRGANVPARNEYNQMECIEQWKSERFLEDHLKGLGVAVERGTELVNFEQKWDHVDCDLGVSGATKKLKVGFLVGCDGGSSFVRKKLGYEFKGSVAKESFVSAHCYARGRSAPRATRTSSSARTRPGPTRSPRECACRYPCTTASTSSTSTSTRASRRGTSPTRWTPTAAASSGSSRARTSCTCSAPGPRAPS
ncbi:unnamed protein product [Prorocentrum cordatum]|uniref:FAD-binding domain-containing protein n=1 Tax=Prorocentrum cordatum TaxID=2364126 RepID=A0ABN9W896_9DINO|nr:unnamed protein product [Polarella glacialis]